MRPHGQARRSLADSRREVARLRGELLDDGDRPRPGLELPGIAFRLAAQVAGARAALAGEPSARARALALAKLERVALELLQVAEANTGDAPAPGKDR